MAFDTQYPVTSVREQLEVLWERHDQVDQRLR